jgi:hypothetical protein
LSYDGAVGVHSIKYNSKRHAGKSPKTGDRGVLSKKTTSELDALEVPGATHIAF